MPDSNYAKKHIIETENEDFTVDVEEIEIELSSGKYYNWKANFTNEEGDTFTVYLQNEDVTIAGFDGKFTKKEEKSAAEAVYKIMGIYQEKTGQDIDVITCSYHNDNGKDISTAFYKALKKKLEFEKQGNWLEDYASRTNKYLMDIVPGSIRGNLKDIEKYDEMTIDDFKNFTDEYTNNSKDALEKFKLKDIRKYLENIGANGKAFIEMMQNNTEDKIKENFSKIDFSDMQTMINTLNFNNIKENFDNSLEDKIKENTNEDQVFSINEKSQER